MHMYCLAASFRVEVKKVVVVACLGTSLNFAGAGRGAGLSRTWPSIRSPRLRRVLVFRRVGRLVSGSREWVSKSVQGCDRAEALASRRRGRRAQLARPCRGPGPGAIAQRSAKQGRGREASSSKQKGSGTMPLADVLHLGNHHKASPSGYVNPSTTQPSKCRADVRMRSSGTTTPAAAAGERSSAAGSPAQTPPMTSSPTSTSTGASDSTTGTLSYFSRRASDRIQHISGKAVSLTPFRSRKSGDNVSGRATPTHGGDVVVESPSPASEDEQSERGDRSRSTSPKSQAAGSVSRHWGSFHAPNKSRARRSSSKQRTQVAPPSWPPEEWFLPHTTPPPRPKISGNASGSSKSVTFGSEEDGAGTEEADGFDKEATPTPGYGFRPASADIAGRDGESFGTAGKSVLPGEDQPITAEPASMSAQEERVLSKTASGGRPQLGKLRMEGADHDSTEATPTAGRAPSTRWNDRQDAEEEAAEDAQGDNFAVCDSPGATQSLAPQPRGASPVSSAGEADDERSAGMGRRQASLDAASVMIMDSPSATQSIDIEEMLRRRRLDAEKLHRQIEGLDVSDNRDERKRAMATTASFDPNADPQVFDSPSHTQNIDPGTIFGPPPVGQRRETPSSSQTLRGDADDGKSDQSQSPHSSGPSKSSSLEHHGHHHLPKTSLPHHVANLSHKISAHLPHPTRHLPPTPPSGPMSTSSSTSPPSVTSSASHRSHTTTSGTSSPGSTSRHAGGARPATPQKMWRPPQHPDIVKKQQGGERMIKETLDATSGKNEEGQRMVNQYIFRQGESPLPFEHGATLMRDEAEVGRGSFGAVQLAQDAETGRECAIKVFSKARMRRKMRAEWIRNGVPDDEDQTDALYLIRNEVAIMKKVRCNLLHCHRRGSERPSRTGQSSERRGVVRGPRRRRRGQSVHGHGVLPGRADHEGGAGSGGRGARAGEGEAVLSADGRRRRLPPPERDHPCALL